MNNIISNAVTVANGQVATSSLKIAEVFGKQHKHVLDTIEKLQVPDSFRKPNFGLSEYEVKNSIGKTVKYPMYTITRDGFTILVMGFTGARAMRFKIAYLEEFNRMEAELRRLQGGAVQPELPLPESSFSPLIYRGVPVIPTKELARRLGISYGAFDNWVRGSGIGFVEGVEIFRARGGSGVPGLRRDMARCGFHNPRSPLSWVNLYTEAAYRKALKLRASGRPRVLPEPPVPPALPPVEKMAPKIPRRDPAITEQKLHLTLSDVRLFRLDRLLESLLEAGFDVSREMAELKFLKRLIDRLVTEQKQFSQSIEQRWRELVDFKATVFIGKGGRVGGEAYGCSDKL